MQVLINDDDCSITAKARSPSYSRASALEPAAIALVVRLTPSDSPKASGAAQDLAIQCPFVDSVLGKQCHGRRCMRSPEKKAPDNTPPSHWTAKSTRAPQSTTAPGPHLGPRSMHAPNSALPEAAACSHAGRASTLWPRPQSSSCVNVNMFALSELTLWGYSYDLCVPSPLRPSSRHTPCGCCHSCLASACLRE